MQNDIVDIVLVQCRKSAIIVIFVFVAGCAIIAKRYSHAEKLATMFLLFFFLLKVLSSLSCLHSHLTPTQHQQIRQCPTMSTALVRHHDDKSSIGAMQDIQDFLQEVDLLFNKTRCTICSGSNVTHLDCKNMSRCGHVYHTECLELWEFACITKQVPFQCPDCRCTIVLFHAHGSGCTFT